MYKVAIGLPVLVVSAPAATGLAACHRSFEAAAIAGLRQFNDRSPGDRRADAGFLQALIEHFGEEPFERGNLNAGRLSWLFGREVVAVDDPFDPASYEALLRVDLKKARQSFPDIFGGEE